MNMLDRYNEHKFLEHQDLNENSFIANVNKAVNNIDEIKRFNDYIEEGEVAKLVEAVLVGIEETGNKWSVQLQEVALALTAAKSAFNFATLVTIPEDIANGAEIELPDLAQYTVGTHMLMVSYNGTTCYIGEQYEEIGEIGETSKKIRMLFDLRANDKIMFRVIALNNETVLDKLPVRAEGSTEYRTLEERFGDIINVKDFGAKGDGVTDDTEAIQKALNYAVSLKKSTVVFPPAIYRCDNRIVVEGTGHVVVTGYGATLYSTLKEPIKTDGLGNETTLLDYFIKFTGVKKHASLHYSNEIAKDAMKMDNLASDTAPGDLVLLSTGNLIDTDHRDGWVQGFVDRVSRIDSNNKIVLSEPTAFKCFAEGTQIVTVSDVVNDTQVKLAGLDMKRDMARVMFTAPGVSKAFITDWDNTTKVAMVSSDASGKLIKGSQVTLSWSSTVEIWSPITVEIYGLKLTRDMQKADSASAIGFRGLWIQACDKGRMQDCTIENFSECNLYLHSSYRTSVSNCTLQNANRFYTTGSIDTDGTGYGFVFAYGTAYSSIKNCMVKGCRSGITTAGKLYRTIGNTIENNTICCNENVNLVGDESAPTLPIYDSTVPHPYAMGGHGDSLNTVYSGNHIYNCAIGCTVRDENAVHKNNTFIGTVLRAFYLLKSKNVTLDGNVYRPTQDSKQTNFCRYTAASPVRGKLIISNNIIDSSAAPLLYVSTDGKAGYVLSDIYIIGNILRLNAGVGIKSGIGYTGNPTDFSLTNCVIRGNTIHYSEDVPVADRFGFSGAGYCWDILQNSFVEVDSGHYYCKISPKTDIEIPCATRLVRSNISVSGVTSGNWYVSGITYMNGYNENPVHKALNTTNAETISGTTGRIVVCRSDKLESAKSTAINRLILHNGENPASLYLFNNTDIEQTFFISINIFNY